MTGKRCAGRERRDTRPVTDRAPAHAAARLLDRLRKEPLPEDAKEAAALRKATRNAFLLVEELCTLAAEKAPNPAISRPAPRKKTEVDRPFFLVSEEPEEDRDDRAAFDFEAFRRRADRAYLQHPVGA